VRGVDSHASAVTGSGRRVEFVCLPQKFADLLVRQLRKHFIPEPHCKKRLWSSETNNFIYCVSEFVARFAGCNRHCHNDAFRVLMLAAYMVEPVAKPSSTRIISRFRICGRGRSPWIARSRRASSSIPQLSPFLLLTAGFLKRSLRLIAVPEHSR